MKATDLMIGDIIYAVKEYEDCNGEMVVEKFSARITAIDENGLLGINDYFMCDVLVDCCDFEEFDSVEPIELCEPILRLNGFGKDPYSGRFIIRKENDDYDYYIVVCLDGQKYARVENYKTKEYVRLEKNITIDRLQQALNLVGLEDIANALKI